MIQLDSHIISSLRTVLDDVCGHLPFNSTTARTLVASSILERAHAGEQTYDGLREAAEAALKRAPTMWR
jgi:hypothetical protein